MTTAGPLVLVVEDEAPLVRFLRATLEAHGHRVVDVGTGKGALLQAASRVPDLVLLDLGLPDMDGMDVVRKLREWSKVPVIVVSARGRERDKVEALDAGADDYLTKPFGVEELLARVRVALRHVARAEGSSGAAGEEVFRTGDLRVDLGRRQVFRGDAEVHLSPTEWNLLAILVRHPGKVVLQRQLLREVWGPKDEENTHYLRVYFAQLRRKLEDEPARPRHLLTEPGVGYRLREDDERAPRAGGRDPA